MSLKPKIGLLFLTSGWFRDIGLQTPSSDVSNQVNVIANEIVQKLSSFLEPVYKGVLFTENESKNAALEMRAKDVDGLVVAPLMWCEDEVLRAALKVLPDLPILLCTFIPNNELPEFISYQEMIKGSGLVGTLQMSGFLRRECFEYYPVTGYFRDPDVYREIKNYCFSFAVKQNLKNVKCGVLPFRCSQMSTTYVDEFSIRKMFGIELVYLELQRLKTESEKVTPAEIELFNERIKNEKQIVEVDQRNLDEAIKYSLAIEKVISKEHINIFVMNDIIDEMHACFGLRPCLTNPDLSVSGVVVAMEADIAAGIAMYILRLYTGESPFYGELFTADLGVNAFLIGHPGYHDSSNYDKDIPIKIVADVEYKNSDVFTGACTFFKYKPGPVTAINCVFNGEKLMWTVFEGESLEGPFKMEGVPHLFCSPDIPIKQLCNRAIEAGISQHWIIIPGHVIKNIEILCSCLDIKFNIL